MNTKTVYIAHLERKAPLRPAGYVDRVKSFAIPGTVTSESFEMKLSDWQKLADQYAAAKPPEDVVEKTPYHHDPRKPGDLLSMLIKKITGATPSKNCKCNARRDMMNRNGWWWCWKNRKTIEQWLAEEAGNRGHAVDEHQTASLVRAAFKEMFSRKKDTE